MKQLQKELTTFLDEISRVYTSNFPFVVFRKPNEELITAYVQNSKEVHYLNSYNEQGFVFSPFNKVEKKVFFSVENCEIFSSKIPSEFKLNAALSNSNFENISAKNSKEKHIKLIKKGIDFIKSKEAEKIVLSRKEELKFKEFDVINTLKKMLNNYKNAFVYLWYHPTIGLWMGATPERLINLSENKFTTMALAGTQLYKNTTDVVWKEKEQQEQQFVTDYILDTINECVENIEVSNPYTVKAGNLLHIRTDISGTLKSENIVEKLINTLHPTPAVCGLPKEIATTFILENEGYNRAYYSGYLGELNRNKNTQLFVNLRCMEWHNNTASIYIGGGITMDSIPSSEWKETVSKAEIMKKVL